MLSSHEKALFIFFIIAPCAFHVAAWKIDFTSIVYLCIINCLDESEIINKCWLSFLLESYLAFNLEFLSILMTFSFHLATRAHIKREAPKEILRLATIHYISLPLRSHTRNFSIYFYMCIIVLKSAYPIDFSKTLPKIEITDKFATVIGTLALALVFRGFQLESIGT